MVELTRRTVLAAGAVVVGGAAAATAVLLPRSGPARADASTSPPRTTAPAAPVRQAPVVRFGAPVLAASPLPRTTSGVMQQIELAPTGELFMTQSIGLPAPGRYTTVVTRCAPSTDPVAQNAELDAMTIVEGGHGVGLHVEALPGGGHELWMSLQGPAAQGDPTGGRLARFAYTPGTWQIDGIPGGVTWFPQFTNDVGAAQEAIYAVDRSAGVVVERMYDFRTNRDERYTLRSIEDLLAGVDRPLARVTVPVNPPTTQGFATLGGDLLRWGGRGNAGSGAPVTDDPMALEQFDWATGERVAVTPFPTLGQDGSGAWRGGTYEPEGCSVVHDADGTAALLVGVTVGRPGDHAWPVYRLPVV